MSKGASLARSSVTLGLLVLPLLASAADKSCWLSDAAAPAPTTVYLVCEQGTLFVTTDGGAKFTAVDTQATTRLLAMAFTDVSHGVIVGDAGTMLATEDGGKTWKRRESGSKENLRAISNVGKSLWVSGFDGTVMHSADGGLTWEKQKSGTSQALEGIYFLDADHGWAVGWAGTILRTVDGGKKWTEIKSAAASWTLHTVYFRDANIGWAVGFSGQMLHSVDGGLTWKAQSACAVPGPNSKPGACDPIRAGLTSVAIDRSNRVWITADDQLLVSEDGEKYKAIDYDGQLYMRKFVPVGDSLWAVGQLGVLKQVGATTDWKPLPNLVVGSAAVMNMAAPSAKKPSE